MSKFSISKLLAQQVAFPAHSSFVSSRRDRRLAELIVSVLPEGPLTGLDIGCGSGVVAKLVQDLHQGAILEGTDLQVRPNAVIPVQQMSGESLPFADDSFDFAILIDVLHHTLDPSLILRQAIRVSRKFVIIKDHFCESTLDRLTLQFMDWVGNRAHDVPLPFNYLCQLQWQELHNKCGVRVSSELTQLNLYSQPLSFFFDRQLHFVRRLEKV